MSLLSVSAAFAHVGRSVLPSARIEHIPLAHGRGRVLASPVLADRAYPPYDRVMMDGVCFSSASLVTGRAFTLAGTLHAGECTPPPALALGQAWRINTGAALPADCDCVVPVEELALTDERAAIITDFQPQPYQFVHRCGSDTAAGATVLPAGTILDSAALSIAVSVGALELSVIAHPRVFILTTGQEAIPPDQQPSATQIRRSHPTALTSALQHLGITGITHVHLPDDYQRMQNTLTDAIQRADLILTCGAISKGSSDYLGTILTELCGVPAFHGVAQRPGKPLAYWPATTPDTPHIFALPGNALSTLITFHRYVRPAISTLLGHRTDQPGTAPHTAPTTVTVAHQLPDFHLTRFLPVRLTAPGHAQLLSPQNSGDFSALAGSQGFIELSAGTPPASPALLPFYPWL